MTGRYVAPSGSEIYFEEAGAGRPILALHGVGGGAYVFRGVAERLRAPYRVVAIDLPGTGRSIPRGVDPAETAKSLSLDGWMTDLGAFVREHLQEPTIIIGHSLGTILALNAWRRFPGSILALVFVGGLPVVRPLMRERLSERIAAIARDGGLSGWGAKVSPANFSPAAFASRPEVIGLFERVFELQGPEAYLRSIEILLEASAVDVVPTVGVPVASISGLDDLYAPPENVREFLTALPRPARVTMLPDVGHLPFLEAPEAFCTALREFLLNL